MLVDIAGTKVVKCSKKSLALACSELELLHGFLLLYRNSKEVFKMNRGIYANVQRSKCNNVWLKMVSLLSTPNMKWIVDCLECHSETTLDHSTYTTFELLSILRQEPTIFFARMIGLPADAPPEKPIITAGDYLASSCSCLILCVDGAYFEVFAKDEKTLATLFSSFEPEEVEMLHWIDDTFDSRTDFRV